MINKEGVKIVIGAWTGAFIGLFILGFTQPIVWVVVLIILILSIVIDWGKLKEKEDERDAEEKGRASYQVVVIHKDR